MPDDEGDTPKFLPDPSPPIFKLDEVEDLEELLPPPNIRLDDPEDIMDIQERDREAARREMQKNIKNEERIRRAN